MPIWRPSVAGITAAAVLSGAVLATEGFESRLTRVIPDAASRAEKASSEQFIDFTGDVDGDRPVIVIIGDSYAWNWAVSLNRYIAHDRYDVTALSYLGCDVAFAVGRVQVSRLTGVFPLERCGPLEQYLNEPKVIGRTVAIFLVSHRPFEYTANSFRFDLAKWIRDRGNSPDIYVFGNYFQLDPKKMPSCLNYMFRTNQNAAVCLEDAAYRPPDLDLKSQPLYPHDLDFSYIDLISIYCEPNKVGCAYDADGIPFMYDWNHLTITFLTKVLGEIIAKKPETLKENGLAGLLTAKWQPGD